MKFTRFRFSLEISIPIDQNVDHLQSKIIEYIASKIKIASFLKYKKKIRVDFVSKEEFESVGGVEL